MPHRIMWRADVWLLAGALIISGGYMVTPQEVKAVDDKSNQAGTIGNQKPEADSAREIQTATFGGGCFWCVEAVFEELEGVTSVESGYAGGEVDKPTYEAVCTGVTGHAEVCQIHYNESKTSFAQLLEVFFKTHDPTTLNRQGADRGTQYRSVVFYHDEQQKEVVEKHIAQLEKDEVWGSPIVTEVSPLPKYFPAEEYHQDYFKRNPFKGYCRVVINPKVRKFRSTFRDKLKSANE